MSLIEKASEIYREGKINDLEFHTYALFMGSDLGQGYLKNALESILMEEPPGVGEYAFSYYSGRISVWRQIKTIINGINNLLDGKNYDGSSDGNEVSGS